MQKKRIPFNQITKIMRFTAIQIIVAALTFSCLQANTSNAQEILNQRISLNKEKVQLVSVLNSIEEQANVSFTYSQQKIVADQNVSIQVDNKKLKTVLKTLFKPLAIDYKVFNDRTIVLTKNSSTKIGAVALPPITGQVSDIDGNPLIGASVAIKGKASGAVTDLDGKYSLNCEAGDVLIFSYTGYEPKEVTVGDQTVINVILTEGISLEGITVIGSRGKPRTDVDRPVPIDVITAKELVSTGQQDIGQSLHYTAPSFSAVKFGINDLAPLVDPASLRGLSPDQTLLLVNGKRRHKVAFFSNNSGVGKGQVANDINAIPSAAVKRVEILRDGAAAQYGSDAIAGVMNMQLNDSNSGGSFRAYTGVTFTSPEYDEFTNAGTEGDKIYGDDAVTDGQTFSSSLNFGMPWGDDGFVNTTLHFAHSEPTDRSGTYTHSAGWYTADQIAAAGLTTDEELQAVRGINLDRAVLGTAENTNRGIFINAGKAMSDDWDFYAFGGLTSKEVVGGVFSRSPTRSTRRELSIFPNGFNPEVPSVLTDWQVSSGAKGDLGNDWALDFSLGYSGNNVDLFARNTINPSLSSDSPTQFYTGSLNVTQTVINADVTKTLENTSIAFGAEQRFESFQQSQGQIESWMPGPDATRPVLDSIGNVIGVEGFKDVGASGREGFTDRSDGEWNRSNLGVYLEVESDITEDFLVAGAVRFENYSDFGSDFSYKLATRYKITDQIGIRASYNRSFRAPSLNQVYYSNFAQIEFDNDGNSVVSPFLPVGDQLLQTAFGSDGLKQEISNDIAVGVTAKLNNFFTVTVDAYQIGIEDRIIALGGINPNDFAEFNGAGYDAITVFTNAINTKTQGLDIVLNFKKTMDNESRIAAMLAANFNSTEEDGISSELPRALADYSVASNDLIYLLEGSPNRKIIGSFNYSIGKFGFLIRGTNFGEVTEPRVSDADGNPQILSSKTVIDLSITANLTDKFSITAGANNLFDAYPDMLLAKQVRSEVIYSRRVNQFGTMGRFLNLSLNYNW